MRHTSSMKPLWFARKRDVSLLFIRFCFISVHLISSYNLPLSSHPSPALVKPSSGPRAWSKAVRRRSTMSFTPAIDQIADPEPGSFQHKSHVGIDEKGNIVAEGEVERKWTDFLNGPTRAKVSLPS